MLYRYGWILNNKYADGTTPRDIAINTKPLVMISFGKNAGTADTETPVNRPQGRKDYQLIYISKGEMEIMLDNTPTVCGANTLILFHPGEPQIHRVLPGNQAVRYFMNFSGSEVEAYLSSYGIHTNKMTFPSTFTWFEQIFQEMDAMQYSPFKEDICNHLLTALLGIIGTALRNISPSNSNLFSEVLHMMRNHCTKDVPVETYAKAMGYNKTYFISFFKKATGYTPHQYIRQCRMRVAKTLLLTTNLPVKHIATQVGYPDTRYFSRLFFQYYLQTPSDFRKNNHIS